MTDDRELLELAAKAAGHAIDRIDAMHDPEDWACWNPLEDDGDALRLAADLGLDVYPVARTALGYACSAVGTTSRGRLAEVIGHCGTRAATRRAIVMAAAAIGRAMP